MSTKERLDKLLVQKGLASNRTRAQALILSGNVLVNDQPVTKSGSMVQQESNIRVRGKELPYVSRGALKLKGALENFKIKVQDKTAIDIGSSTGGFTEVLLENGATRVCAVDVGTNQLDWKLRSDERVQVRENFNARYIESDSFGMQFDILVMDVSFISIRLILPAAAKVLKPGATCVVLFKPQFELGPEHVGDGGIVKDQEYAQKVLKETIQFLGDFGYDLRGTMDSPITGTDGNCEYLIWLERRLDQA